MPQLSPAQLANMRQVMAQNPAMAQALIQQIAATNPALLQQLGANPEQFLAGILQSAAAEDLGEDDDEGPVPPGAHCGECDCRGAGCDRESMYPIPLP
jgi:UV excision repair protein RAD23